MFRQSPNRMSRLFTGPIAASPLPSMSPQLFRRTVFRQSLRLFQHGWKESRLCQKDQKVCASERKRLNCIRLLRAREIETQHVCRTLECPSCKEYHNLYRHQCYIQNPTKLEQKRKLLKSRKPKADGSQSSQTKENLFI